MSDNVNKPAHYNMGEVECIDAIESALGRDGFIAYCRGNVIKYTFRAPHKGGQEDLEKATVYAGWAKAGTAHGRPRSRLLERLAPLGLANLPDLEHPHTGSEALAAEQVNTALAAPELNHAGPPIHE